MSACAQGALFLSQNATSLSYFVSRSLSLCFFFFFAKVSRTSSFTASDRVVFQAGDYVTDAPADVRAAAAGSRQVPRRSSSLGGSSSGSPRARTTASFQSAGFHLPLSRQSSFSFGVLSSVLGRSGNNVPVRRLSRNLDDDNQGSSSFSYNTARPRGTVAAPQLTGGAERVSLGAIESAGDVEMQQASRASVQVGRRWVVLQDKVPKGRFEWHLPFATLVLSGLFLYLPPGVCGCTLSLRHFFCFFAVAAPPGAPRVWDRPSAVGVCGRRGRPAEG